MVHLEGVRSGSRLSEGSDGPWSGGQVVRHLGIMSGGPWSRVGSGGPWSGEAMVCHGNVFRPTCLSFCSRRGSCGPWSGVIRCSMVWRVTSGGPWSSKHLRWSNGFFSQQKFFVVRNQHVDVYLNEKISTEFSSLILNVCFATPWKQKIEKELWQCRKGFDLNPTYDQCMKTVLQMDVAMEVFKWEESIFATPWW